MAGKVINSFSWISTADRNNKLKTKVLLVVHWCINSCFSSTLEGADTQVALWAAGPVAQCTMVRLPWLVQSML